MLKKFIDWFVEPSDELINTKLNMPILDKYPSMDEQSKCDEEQFECVEGVCNKVSLYCKDSCIAKSWVFDEEIDCTDESDEVDYKLEINCYWAIYAPNASKLQLTISDFGFSDEVTGKINVCLRKIRSKHSM